MLLSSVHIQNFRCLRDVRFELGPLTFFVGPNASGKTAIADALVVQNRGTDSDRWRKGSDHPSFNGERSAHVSFGHGRLKYAFTPASPRSTSMARECFHLDSAGVQLANLIGTLPRSQQAAFVEQFTTLVPMYADVSARPSDGNLLLHFRDRWDESLWFRPEEVSDGTLLTAAFVALAFQRDVPDLIVMEDPDYGLHPYLQRHIVALLRRLSRGEIGTSAVQVVCTTHSRALLDVLEPEEVRFLRRSPDTGETIVEAAPVDSPRWKEVYQRHQESLGSLWMTGAVGGVPGI